MDTEKRFFVGDVVKIVGSESGNRKWIGLTAVVKPWPEGEPQYEDGLLHNWLEPLDARPDEFGHHEFMWPTRHLNKVG